MRSPSPCVWSLILATATTGLTGCSGGGGLLQVVFDSTRKVDGTDALNANRTSNIWFVKSDGTGLTPLTTATAARASSTSPGWSADGFRIIFASSLKLDGSDAQNLNAIANVWKVNANGTGLMAITTATALGTDSEFPQWSPDGVSVVFDSSRKLDGTDAANNNRTRNIWRVNADGTNLRRLTSATAANAHSAFPQWSPDGTKIAFSSFRKLDGTDAASSPILLLNIWRVNADGTNLIPITRTTMTPNYDPRWSPDGTKVLFSSLRALDGTDSMSTPPVSNLWQMNGDGTGLRPLTNNTARGADNFSGQWAPDGSKVAFASARKLDGSDAANANNTGNIWRVNSDGSGLIPLTRTTANHADSVAPSWSRDGTKVVFTSSRNLDGTDSPDANATINIWRVNADGTGLTALTKVTSGAVSSSPSFD